MLFDKGYSIVLGGLLNYEYKKSVFFYVPIPLSEGMFSLCQIISY